MKNLFGKVLVGAAGLVMALGINAFAASEIAITTVTPDKETGKVTISGTITADAASPESTILVVPEGTSLATLEDAQIRYIDQETAASGAFSYEFVLETGKKYTVWCGGTDVAAPDDDVIDLVAGEVTGNFKIVGKVTLVEGADARKVTAAIGDNKVNADETGTYTLEVAPGTYEVVVGRAGYLYRTFKDVQVTDKDVELAETALLAGDLVESDPAYVNLSDLQALLNAYGISASEDGFNAIADLNDDGLVSLPDLQILLNDYGIAAADYED